MKNQFKKSLVFILFLLPLMLQTKISPPFIINLDTVESKPKSNIIEVELKVSPQFKCSEIQFTIQTFGNIHVAKETIWTDACSQNQVKQYSFTVTIPENDTTGFEVRVQSGEIWHHAYLYFVKHGDKVDKYKGNPIFDITYALSDTISFEDIEGSDVQERTADRPHDRGTISFNGNVFYTKHGPLNIGKYAKHVKIEIWDANPDSSDVLLWTGETDDLGCYYSPIFQNSEPDQTTLDIYLKIYAENPACKVCDAVDGGIYHLTTNTWANMSDGVHFFSFCPTSESLDGAFHIADAIFDGYVMWNLYSPDEIPNEVTVVYPNDPLYFVGTYYDSGLGFIMICGDNDPGYGYPDTFDEDVILHEYGHRIEDLFDFYDGGGGSHYWDGLYTEDLAASEGWATCWSGIVNSDPYYFDRWNNFQNCYYTNIENGEWGANINSHYGSATAYGNTCEAAVGGMMWDIYDNVDDDYDNDGIGDTYSNGIDNMLNTLFIRTVNAHHPETSDDFWDAWFAEPSLGSDQQIWAIWREHGDNKDNLSPNAPDITDCSHTIGLWSTDNTISIFWEGSDNGPSGIAGYSYEWTESPSTIPDNASEGVQLFTTSPLLSNGDDWYFHIKARDNADNWGDVTHYGPFFINAPLPPQPLAPENLNIIRLGNNNQLMWDSVTQDIDGNPINVSYYQIETSEYPNSEFVILGTTMDTHYIDTSSAFLNRFYRIRAVIESRRFNPKD
jgi:hypothetical protein